MDYMIQTNNRGNGLWEIHNMSNQQTAFIQQYWDNDPMLGYVSRYRVTKDGREIKNYLEEPIEHISEAMGLAKNAVK